MFKIRCDGVVPMMDALSTDNESASMDSVVPDEDSSNDEYVEVVTKRNAVNKSEKQVKTNKRTKKRNNTKYKKEKNEPMYTIIKQTSYFPPESMCKLTGWHLYKIKVANYDYFGFIVPCILGKIPPFTFPRNNVESIVQVEYVEPIINYNKYKDQFEKFCRYIFEEDFTDMNTGPEAILKFDIESSPFKLLPCLLTNLGSIDYRQMHLICSKTNGLDQNLQEIDHDDDDDVGVQSSSSVVQFPARLPQIISSKRKAVQRMFSKRSNTGTCEYFDKTTIMTATKEDDICYSHEKSKIKDEQSTLQSSHAPLPISDRDISNHKKSQFAPQLPKILDLISQVFYKNKLRELLIDATGSHSEDDLDGISPATFANSLPPILSSPDVWPQINLSHDLVSKNNCGLHPKFDLLFQATTCHLADKNNNMENLETFGDSFLKITTSLSVSYQYPVGEDKKLTVERDKHVCNENLCRLAREKGLHNYLNAHKSIYSGNEANWLPPGYKVDDEKNVEKYIKRKVKQKAIADMVEALIGCYLVSTDYITTLKFMQWLGLNVIPLDEQRNVITTFPLLRPGIKIKKSIEEMFYEKSFTEIEERLIAHKFKERAYLIAAFTHPSYNNTASTISYNKLKFVGNPLFEFLLTRYIFVEKKLTTPHEVTRIRNKLANSDHKASIMKDHRLYTKLLFCEAEHAKTVSDTDSEQSSMDHNNIAKPSLQETKEVQASIFDALIGAIFFDTNCSLNIVWDAICFLMQSHIDDAINNLNL